MRWNPLTRQPKPKTPEFPKQNQTIITGGGFNPSRYYNKSEIDALLANFTPDSSSGWSDFQTLDVSNLLLDFATFEPVDLGTDGYLDLEWRTDGSVIDGYIKGAFDSDNSMGTPSFSVWLIPGASLPALPKLPGGPTAYAMGFGYVSAQASGTPEEPVPGATKYSPPAIVDFEGGANPEAEALIAFIAGSDNVELGFEGLTGNGNPINVTGKQGALIGKVYYRIKDTV